MALSLLSSAGRLECPEASSLLEHPYFEQRPYSVLMTGPSGSRDIVGIVVHPAQGVKSLTVILSPAPNPGKRTG
jgi:hypothetical protein